MRFLPNPRLQVVDDAMVQFTMQDEALFRMRFATNTATTGVVQTDQTAIAVFTPHEPLLPGQPSKVSHDGTPSNATQTNAMSLIHPTGPAPADATGADLRFVDNPNINYDTYADQYTRCLPIKTDYNFKIYNYQDFPILVGITVLLTQVVVGTDESGVPDETVLATDYGNDTFGNMDDFKAVRLVEFKSLQNTKMGVVPAGQYTGGHAKVAGQGSTTSGDALHMNPGIGTVQETVHTFDIMKKMAMASGESGFDIDHYAAAYPGGASACLIAPLVVILWVCPATETNQELFDGTAADTDDHWNGLTFEGWGTACDDWTGKIFVEPIIHTTMRLFDPKVVDGYDAGDPDTIQVG